MSHPSLLAKKLIADYAAEELASHEWSNDENVKRTRAVLFAYIFALEQLLEMHDPSSLRRIQAAGASANKSFTGGGL